MQLRAIPYMIKLKIVLLFISGCLESPSFEMAKGGQEVDSRLDMTVEVDRESTDMVRGEDAEIQQDTGLPTLEDMQVEVPFDQGVVDMEVDVDQMLILDEECDGRDNDDDGRVDEDIPDRRCDEVFEDVYGVCAESFTSCVDGSWISCELSVLVNESRYRDYLGEEQCDCHDNDCDGVVDEVSLPCAPDISSWMTSINQRPERHCHYRSLTDEAVNIYLQPSQNLVYTLDSLTIEDNCTLWIQREGSLGLEGGPSFIAFDPDEDTHLDTPPACYFDRLGGSLTLVADQITLQQGAALRADSSNLTCNSEGARALNGASGGHIELIASQITNAGEISASGSNPRPKRSDRGPQYGVFVSGGAAGTIVLTSPDLSLAGDIVAQGGKGRCPTFSDDNQACAENEASSYSGYGPGSRGGRPYSPQGNNTIGGAGSGGRAYTEQAPKGIALLGHLSLSRSARLFPEDGNGFCSGQLDLSHPVSETLLACALGMEESTDYPIEINELTWLAFVIDQSGRPVIDNSLVIEIYKVIEDETATTPFARASLFRAVATLTAEQVLTPGERYQIRLVNDQNQVTNYEKVYLVLNRMGSADLLRLGLDDGKAIFEF